MTATRLASTPARPPFKVADLELADLGRKEIRLAEHEMPGLMAGARALRQEQAPRRRPDHGQPAHDGADGRLDRDARRPRRGPALGQLQHLLDAGSRGGRRGRGTQRHAGVAAGHAGLRVDETLEEYWWCTLEALVWPDGSGPHQIVDDGGDATLLVHKGVEFEKAGKVPDFDPDADPEEWGVILDLLRQQQLRDPHWWTPIAESIRGVSEETTTGVHRLYQMQEAGTLLFPAINVNDSVTKSKFDNIYGCRHSLPDGLARATDVMLGGKVAVICGFGEVGKGCAQALRGQGCRVVITEIDPICALQAAMEGYQVATLEDVVETADIFVTTTGNRDIIRADHMARMKDKAIVGNIGHFDNEIDMAGIKKLPGTKHVNIKPQYDEWIFADGHSVLVLAEGRLLNLGCATGHPSFVMSASFTNQVLAQIELIQNREKYGREVYVLPKALDEEVARLHLDQLGVKLTRLTPEQADYIGVPVDGPYKPDHYRY
jgi:adenosylhomocysteinase